MIREETSYKKRFMATYFPLNMARNAMAVGRRIGRLGLRMAGVRRVEDKMESNREQKRLVLFFTLGISLKLWDQMGYLSRESRTYKRLASRLGEVYFLNHGKK